MMEQKVKFTIGRYYNIVGLCGTKGKTFLMNQQIFSGVYDLLHRCTLYPEAQFRG